MTIRDSATGQRTTLLRVATATWLLLVSAVKLVDYMALSAGGTDPGPLTARCPCSNPDWTASLHGSNNATQPAAPAAGALRGDTAVLDQRLAGDRAGAGPSRCHRCAARIETCVTRLESSPASLAPAQAARCTTAIPTRVSGPNPSLSSLHSA